MKRAQVIAPFSTVQTVLQPTAKAQNDTTTLATYTTGPTSSSLEQSVRIHCLMQKPPCVRVCLSWTGQEPLFTCLGITVKLDAVLGYPIITSLCQSGNLQIDAMGGLRSRLLLANDESRALTILHSIARPVGWESMPNCTGQDYIEITDVLGCGTTASTQVRSTTAKLQQPSSWCSHGHGGLANLYVSSW